MGNNPYTITAILLSGGTGARMGAPTPKQYLTLGGVAIARHSFDLLLATPSVEEVVVVCEESCSFHFEAEGSGKAVTFALPGRRRQESLSNGFLAMKSHSDLVLVHDAARPFITRSMVEKGAEAALQCGASAVGVPLKFTLKELTKEGYVASTPDRTKYWEIQTPQFLRRSLLEKGLEKAREEGWEVTDDVSLAELLELPVKVVEGDYRNIKITTPEDLAMAEILLKKV